MEEEELQKSIESNDRKADELEETIEDLKRDLEMKGDEVSLLIENLNTIDEDYGHFESRVYEILNEFQVAKNRVNEANIEKQQLKDEPSTLIEQLRDWKEKELVLRERVRELEETIEDLKTDLEMKGDEVSLLIENLSTIEEDYYPTSTDEIFYNSQIRLVFPIFGKDLSFSDVENCKGEVNSSKPPTPSSIWIPKDRDPPLCSSSEVDELDGVPTRNYCIWKPKSDTSAVAVLLERCKKSNSTRSSKRWKFRDLLYRSNSDNKDTFIFLASSNADLKKKNNKKASERATEVKVARKVKLMVAGGGVTVAQEGDRSQLLMPYRQDLLGFFANVNRLSRNLKEIGNALKGIIL
ncbi:uncharacterized protein LOC114264427 [Camellia sinensis]|uniref:uncharacterized protein LOC114264427 n=1 Tax=Camellia sinensis TaxID=4442 RepID=UPI001035F048|nr:uncharacterized protein LOC114264427 [Camellia sinensis]